MLGINESVHAYHSTVWGVRIFCVKKEGRHTQKLCCVCLQSLNKKLGQMEAHTTLTKRMDRQWRISFTMSEKGSSKNIIYAGVSKNTYLLYICEWIIHTPWKQQGCPIWVMMAKPFPSEKKCFFCNTAASRESKIILLFCCTINGPRHLFYWQWQ